MPATKYFDGPTTTTGSTVYGIVEQLANPGYFLNDADGTFANAPADPYQEFTEHATRKGVFTYSEARTVWPDGKYTITVYKQAGGSPAPVSDTIIGNEEFDIVSDVIPSLASPATPADVNAQVLDVLSVDTGTELSSIPTTSSTLLEKLNFIFQYFRNRKTVTTSTETLYKEDASTVLGTSTVSDDGVTFVKGEMS